MPAEVEIARLEERVKAIQETQNDLRDMLKEWQDLERKNNENFNLRFDKHHERISNLESWRSWVLGAAAFLGVMLGLLSEKIKSSLWS